MKYRLLAFILIGSAFTLARAQEDEKQQKPPTEIPDFSNLDEYIYEPKSVVQLSFRHLSGAKAQFSGSGTINAPEGAVLPAGTTATRQYHDGNVGPDQRKVLQTDSGGNVITDPNGQGTYVPIAPDGKTNNWNYTDQRQVNDAPVGYIAFHSYSADVTDIGSQKGDSRSTNGLDLAVTHDMGKLLGRLQWSVMAGMSVNDISAKRSQRVAATINTTTQYFSTFGQAVPNAPYSAPTSDTQTVTVDTSVLISSDPVYTSLTQSSANLTGQTDVVLDSWKLKGAYYTFRAGPQFTFGIGSRFHFDVSFGPALIYAGTTFTATQTLTPEIGGDITEVDIKKAYKIRPGLYADASLGFDVTDKTGFFAGAVFQTAQSYTQAIHSTTAQYATKVDLANQNGFRAGMSIRF